jgi:DNA-binding transcriptional LysR family regulator
LRLASPSRRRRILLMSFPGGLRAFYEAIRVGSIRGASEKLELAPSSVSRQIQLLEHEMGAQLFDRSAAGVLPTHAGRLVAEFARSVLLDYDSLRSDINERRGLRTGLIRIAAVESTISARVVAAITAFRARFPGVNFQLKMLPAPKVIEVIKRGEVDLGVTFCAPPDTELSFLARFAEPVVLALSPNHEWANRGAVSLAELRHLALGMPEPSFGVRRLFDAALQAQGLSLQAALTSDSFEALRAFARQGAGGAILPRLAIEAERKAGLLTMLTLDEDSLAHTTADVIALRERRPSRLLRLFIEDMQKVALAG